MQKKYSNPRLISSISIWSHKTRGKEVIKLLETLTKRTNLPWKGNEKNKCFTIIINTALPIVFPLATKQAYTLETFYEKHPFRINDTIIIFNKEYTIKDIRTHENYEIIYNLIDNKNNNFGWWTAEMIFQKQESNEPLIGFKNKFIYGKEN